MGWRLEIEDKDGNIITDNGSGGCMYTNVDGVIYTIPRNEDEIRKVDYDDFDWEKFSLEVLNRLDKDISNSLLGHNTSVAESLLTNKCDKEKMYEIIRGLESPYDFDFMNFLESHETLDEVWVRVT